MQILFQSSDEPSHKYPDQRIHVWIPWKNHGLC